MVETTAQKKARIKARRKHLKTLQTQYHATKGLGSSYWQKKAQQRQAQESAKRIGRETVEAAAHLAEETWKQEVVMEYPDPAHKVTFTKSSAGLHAAIELTEFGRGEAARTEYVSGFSTQPATDWRAARRDLMAVTRWQAQVGSPKPGPVLVKSLEPPTTFGWREEHQTVTQFEKAYNVLLDVDPASRITHVQKTEAGYGVQYLEPHALDVAVPFGEYTKADIEGLQAENKLFQVHQLKRYMAGEWDPKELSPEKFAERTGQLLDLPEDSVIVGTRHGPQGIELQYMARKDLEAKKLMEQPTLHGQLMDWMEGVIPEPTPMERLMDPFGATERELGYWPVGVVKGAEATVGTVEALLGQPSRRSYIPTASGAAVATLISAFPDPIGQGGWGATGEYIEAEQRSLERHGVGILAGEIIFDVGLAYVAGLAIGKIGGAAVKAVKGTKLYAKAATAIRGSRADVWLAQRSSWYYRKTGGVAAGGVSIPPAYKGIPRTFGLMKARQVAAEFLTEPRSYGISIGKTFIEPLSKFKPLPHLISRGGQVSVGYLAQAGFKKSAIEIVAAQRSILPVVTQTQVTRLGIIPYVAGQTGLRLGSHAAVRSALAAGVGLGIGLKAHLKFQPGAIPGSVLVEDQQSEMAARQREILRVASLTRQRQKTRKRLMSPRQLQRPSEIEIPFLGPRGFERMKQRARPTLALSQASMLAQVQIQKQKQKLLLRQAQAQIHDWPVKKDQTFEWPKAAYIPDIPGFALRRKKETAYGSWWFRRHPIAKPREVVELMRYRSRRAKGKKRDPFHKRIARLIG